MCDLSGSPGDVLVVHPLVLLVLPGQVADPGLLRHDIRLVGGVLVHLHVGDLNPS